VDVCGEAVVLQTGVHEDQSTATTLCSWGYTDEILKEEQTKDPDLSIVRSWLNNAITPTETELMAVSPAAEFYWINKEVFNLCDQVLYMAKPDSNFKLVLPLGMQESAIKLHHDIPTYGHRGTARSTAKMQEKFFWYGIKEM